MMNKGKLGALLGTAILSLWTGCGANTLMQDKVKCTIESGEVLTIHYKDKDYIVLAEEIGANEIGEWVGYIYQNISGVMFATVYQDKESDDMINVAADNLFYRAIEADKLTDGQQVLVLADSAGETEAAGQQKILVNDRNVTQLVYLDNLYQVTEKEVEREELGDFITSIAKYMVYDVETLTEISKEEYTKMDWDGGDDQGRAVRVYGNVYHIKNTEEELGVEVNGIYYVAIAVKE